MSTPTLVIATTVTDTNITTSDNVKVSMKKNTSSYNDISYHAARAGFAGVGGKRKRPNNFLPRR